ncbi:MAG: sulfite exporter TauE/SafE family protein [Gammaproteobacteria bacterium]
MTLTEAHLLSALIAGIFGSLHCVAMCGGIATALGVSSSGKHSKLLSLSYQLGRITSYAIAGALVAFLGTQLVSEDRTIAMGLRLVSILFMVGLGLYLAGCFPKFAHIERLGLPIWRKISPLSKRLLPIKSVWQAVALGFLWGWLPCGLVYSILLWSVSAPDALSGALVMVSFGIGTLPAMFLMSLGANQLLVYMSQPVIRKIAGMVVISLAGYSFASMMH